MICYSDIMEELRFSLVCESPYDPELAIAFGLKIHKLRTSQKISQMELAQKANVHPNYISDVERGKKNVSLQVISKLAKALSVNIVDLF